MSLDTYYTSNPIQVYTQNQWDMWDPVVAARFHSLAYWSPLMRYVDLMASAEKNFNLDYESLPGHVNSNPIGDRQMYVDPMYWDARSKRLTGHKHYGQKVQLHELDPLLNQWRTGAMSEDAYLMSLANRQLGYSVVKTTEAIARTQYLTKALHVHYGPMGQGASFADITRDPSSAFNLAVLPQVKLRLSVRSQASLQRFGTWEEAVPGRPGQILAMTTPGVIADLWSSNNDFMIDLVTLQDQRLLLRGSRIDYQGFTFSEGPWDVSLLWNAGRIDTQMPIYGYLAGDDDISAVRNSTGIVAGDGAPDPTISAVDGYQYVGQAHVNTMHYILIQQIAVGDIVAGDHVSIHTVQTPSTGTLNLNYWGINKGVDWTDGNTQVIEVASVENVTMNGDTLTKVVFRTPVMLDYGTVLVASGAAVPIGNAANSDTATIAIAQRDVYAFMTKAQHIHPVVINAARGAHVMAMTKKVEFHTPVPVDDFESVWRHTWNMRCAPNVWEPDLYDVFYCAGSFGNRAAEVTY